MFNPTNLFANRPRTTQLRDRSLVLIRLLTAADRQLLIDFFERWSPDSRRMRFLTAKDKLTEEDLRFLTSADGHDHIAVVAVRLDVFGEEKEALGVARCIRFVQTPESAEMSVAVADEVMRQGLGSTLLDRLTSMARSVGIRRFACEAWAENSGMRALAMGRGGDVRWHGDGTVEYEWPLPVEMQTNGLSWSADAQEELSESVEHWLTLVDQSVRFGIDYFQMLLDRFSDSWSLESSPWYSGAEIAATSIRATPRLYGAFNPARLSQASGSTDPKIRSLH